MTDKPRSDDFWMDVTDDEIVEELGKRFPKGLVITGTRTNRDGKSDDINAWWRGGIAACIGLSQKINSRLIDVANSPDNMNQSDEF